MVMPSGNTAISFYAEPRFRWGGTVAAVVGNLLLAALLYAPMEANPWMQACVSSAFITAFVGLLMCLPSRWRAAGFGVLLGAPLVVVLEWAWLAAATALTGA